MDARAEDILRKLKCSRRRLERKILLAKSPEVSVANSNFEEHARCLMAKICHCGKSVCSSMSASVPFVSYNAPQACANTSRRP